MTIVDYLEPEWACWIAPRDVPGGMDYPLAILEALDACRAVLVVVGSTVADSPHVARELELAVGRHRPMLPVLLDGAPVGGQLEYWLSTPQALDLHTGSIADRLPEVRQAVVRLLGEPAASAPEAFPLPARLGRPRGVGLIGREREQARLLDALKEADTSGQPRVVLIGGEPGIGKTALVGEVARRARADGARVLYGRCDEDLAIPYQPWVEALRHLVVHAPSELLAAHVSARGGELARLVPQLAERVPDLPPLRSDAPEAEHYLLLGAVQDVLARASADSPVVLVLDDLHWADKPSIVVVRHLLTGDAGPRVLVLGTFRAADVAASHPLADLLTALHREVAADRLDLGGLDDTEIVRLMEAAAGHTLDAEGLALAHALSRETSGNPFFANEILRHLSETGVIYQTEDGRWIADVDFREAGALPASVRDVVSRRVARQGEETERVLRLAAIIGRDFDLELLARVAEVDEDELLDVLDGAVTAAVLQEVADRPGTYTFTHALVQHTLCDELSPARQVRAHRRVAEELEALCGDDPADRLGELATHWTAATRPEDLDKAVDYAQRAGAKALAQLAPDDALRWYGQVLDLLDRPGGADDARRGSALAGLGEAQRQAGDPAFRETLLEAAALAQRLDDTQLLIRAVLANTRGIFAAAGKVDAERVDALEAARTATEGDETAERARVLAILASELVWSDADRTRQVALEAIALARRLGDDAALARTAYNVEIGLRGPDDFGVRDAIAREAIEAAERTGDPVLRWQLNSSGVSTAITQGDVAGGEQRQRVADRLANEIGQPFMHWINKVQLAGLLHTVHGRIAEIEGAATEALEIGTATGQPDTMVFYAAQLYVVRREQGRLDEIVELVEQAVADNPGLPVYRSILAECYTELDRPDEARGLLADDASDAFGRFRFDVTWTASMALYARCAAYVGDTEASAHLARLIEPRRDHVASTGITTEGSLDLALGLALSTCTRFEEADAAFARAAAMHERMEAPIFLARTQLGWARMHLDRDAPDDRSRAQELVRSASATAAGLGAVSIERRARQLLDD